MYMKREGIIFMSEGGKDNGFSEIKPVIPAPVETAAEVERSTPDKSKARQVEAPSRGDPEQKKEEDDIFSLEKSSKYFTNLDRIHPHIKEEIEKFKVKIPDKDGEEKDVSILDVGNMMLSEFRHILEHKKFSPELRRTIGAADKYLEQQRLTDAGREFETELFKGLGGGSFQAGRGVYAMMRGLKGFVFEEMDGREKGDIKSAAPEPAPGMPDTAKLKEAAQDLSEMTGLDQETTESVLMSAPIYSGDEAALKRIDADALFSAPLTGDEGIKSGSEAEVKSGDLSPDAGVEANPLMSKSILPAPLGGGDYSQYDGDGDGGKGKGVDGDRHKRLKDFLKKHFGWQAMGIYLLMLLALYCGAVYYTARALEENAERSRAGRSQL